MYFLIIPSFLKTGCLNYQMNVHLNNRIEDYKQTTASTHSEKPYSQQSIMIDKVDVKR